MKKLVLLLLTSSAALAQTSPLAELIALARHGPAAPGLKDGIAKTLSARGGNAVWGQDYLFVSDSPAPVTISLDNQPAVPMAQVAGSSRCAPASRILFSITPPANRWARAATLSATIPIRMPRRACRAARSATSRPSSASSTTA